MGRTALANRAIETRLKSYANEQKFCIGLIIGQPSEDGKDYIMHIAKTKLSSDEPEETEETSSNAIGSLEDVNSQVVLQHAATATRMIPGSFYILGIFIVSENNIFQDDKSSKLARQLVVEIANLLSESKTYWSDTDTFDNGEKLILHYSFTSKAITCRSVDTKEISGSLKPADWKFLDKPTSWCLFETNYDTTQDFPLVKSKNSVNLEENYTMSLDAISKSIENSTIFVQSEFVDETQTLEAFIKSKQNKKEPVDSFKSTIYFPATIPDDQSDSIDHLSGTVRFHGIIFSRIWVQPKCTFKVIERFIRNDILRSMASRLQIYCDGLAEPTLDDVNLFVSEPPRRVFIKVADSGGIQFSEYLFRGELPDVVIDQAKDMLDLDIEADDVKMNYESPCEDEIATVPDNTAKDKDATTQADSRKLYLAGIIGGLIILILSLVLHFLLR